LNIIAAERRPKYNRHDVFSSDEVIPTPETLKMRLTSFIELPFNNVVHWVCDQKPERRG
jgi:hypothetical protein